jgi:hypothetical protein
LCRLILSKCDGLGGGLALGSGAYVKPCWFGEDSSDDPSEAGVIGEDLDDVGAAWDRLV